MWSSVLNKSSYKLTAVSRCYSLGDQCPRITVRKPIVTVLDACSTIGRNLALLLKQAPLVSELRIYDADKDVSGIGFDLNELDTHTTLVAYHPNSLREAIEGADIVVSVGGSQKKPAQTTKQLFNQNVDNVRNAALFLSEFNPKAIFCVAKPPLEALIPMVTEEYKKSETYDYRKIIGVTAPISMITNKVLSLEMNKNPSDVLCPIIGGFSAKTVIPAISQLKPAAPVDPKTYSKLFDAIASAEEVLIRNGGIFKYSYTAAIARFLGSVIRAFRGDPNCVECAFVAQPGHIGEFLPYMTSIVKLGGDGIASTHMPKLDDIEVKYLKEAVPQIMTNIVLGQSFVTGDTTIPTKFRAKRVCDEALKQKMEECSIRSGLKCAAE